MGFVCVTVTGDWGLEVTEEKVTFGADSFNRYQLRRDREKETDNISSCYRVPVTSAVVSVDFFLICPCRPLPIIWCQWASFSVRTGADTVSTCAWNERLYLFRPDARPTRLTDRPPPLSPPQRHSNPAQMGRRRVGRRGGVLGVAAGSTVDSQLSRNAAQPLCAGRAGRPALCWPRYGAARCGGHSPSGMERAADKLQRASRRRRSPFADHDSTRSGRNSRPCRRNPVDER